MQIGDTESVDALDVARAHAEYGAGTDMVLFLREFVERWQRADTVERDHLFLDDPVGSRVSPDIECRFPAGLDFNDYRGWEGLAEFWTQWLDMWEMYTFEVERHQDLGDGVILTVARVHARGRGGVPVDAKTFELRRVRDSLIVSWEVFGSEQEALRAVEQR